MFFRLQYQNFFLVYVELKIEEIIYKYKNKLTVHRTKFNAKSTFMNIIIFLNFVSYF